MPIAPSPRSRHRRTPRFCHLPLVLVIVALCTVFPRAAATPYTHLSYAQIHLRLVQLSRQYPSLLRLYSAQDRFLLPHVGNCSQFPDDVIDQSATAGRVSSRITIPDDSLAQPAPCTIWVVELSNFDTLPNDPARPQWLVSGELHGDEVVGPITVLAFIEYMVSRYSTSSFARDMIDSRLSTLVPMTNAVGFFNNRRVETQIAEQNGDNTDASSQRQTDEVLDIDPNRDFGYDQLADKCMQTVAARALNELYRVHLYRVAITFHGGTNALGYEWGDMTHCDGRKCHPAPDASIMHALAKRMSDNAGPAGSYESAYPVGDMGRLVYPVHGGMEDWGYGASWTALSVVCAPTTLGGYPASKTAIDRKTKRAVTYLVEMSKEKRPAERTLGGDTHIEQRGAEDDGHVPRNVRLLFSAIDAIEPYVIVNDIESIHGAVSASWVISGAFAVDATALLWSTANGTEHGILNVYNGTAGLPIAGGHGTVFNQDLPKGFPKSREDPVYFRIAAVVDRVHAVQPKGAVPDMPPQSHLMGARSSSAWVFSVDGREIAGRRVFFSRTVAIGISPNNSFTQNAVANAVWTDGESQQDAEGMRLHAPAEADLVQQLLEKVGSDVGSDLLPSASLSDGKHIILIAGVASIACIVAIAIIIYLLIRYRRGKRERDKAYFHPPGFPGGQREEERTALSTDNVNV